MKNNFIFLSYVWKLLSISIGSFFILATFATIAGYPFTSLKIYVDNILLPDFTNQIARRIIRFLLIRIPELALYGYMGALTFRYVARLVPITLTTEREIGFFSKYFMARFLIIVGSASLVAFIGVIDNPRQWLFPFIIFMTSLVFCLYLRYYAVMFNMEGRILYLRRFGSFSDRSVVNTVLRLASRSARGLMYLIPSDEPVANWDPWITVYGGLKIIYPYETTPLYFESSNRNWVQNVRRLINLSGCIIIDISELSSSILQELKLVSEVGVSKRTIIIFDEKHLDTITMHMQNLKDLGFGTNHIVIKRSWSRAIPRMIFALLFVIFGTFMGIFAISSLFGLDIFNPWNVAFPGRSILFLASIAVVIINAIMFFISFALKPSITKNSARCIRERVRSVYFERYGEDRIKV
jgi:hypothetical protein